MSACGTLLALAAAMCFVLCSCRAPETVYKPTGLSLGHAAGRDVRAQFLPVDGVNDILRAMFGEYCDKSECLPWGTGSTIYFVEPDSNTKPIFTEIAQFVDEPVAGESPGNMEPSEIPMPERFFAAIYLFCHIHLEPEGRAEEFLRSVIESAARDSLFSGYARMLLANLLWHREDVPRRERAEHYQIVAQNKRFPRYMRFGAKSHLGLELFALGDKEDALKVLKEMTEEFPEFHRWPAYKRAEALLCSQP
jgi:hypothetical protein